MNVVYKSISKLKNIYNQINPATLTGAIDIIVVEQPDGSLVASPFHVRFGKVGVLAPRARVVNISINGSPVEDLKMKLGEQGEAFFVMEGDNGVDQIPPQLVTSPIPSRPPTPSKKHKSDDEASCCSLQDHDGDCKKKRMRKKRRRKNDLTVEMPPEIDNRTSSQSSSDSYGGAADTAALFQAYYDVIVNRDSRHVSESTDYSGKDADQRNFFSDSELQNNRSRDEEVSSNEMAGKYKWGWGGLPDENARDSSSSSSDDNVNENKFSENDVTENVVTESNVNANNVNETADKLQQTNLNEPNDQFRSLSSEEDDFKLADNCNETGGCANDMKTLTKTLDEERVRKDSGPLYLDEIDKLGPHQADLYLKVKKDAPVQPPNQLTDKNLQIVRAVSPGSDSGTDNTEYWDKNSEQCSIDQMNISASMCGLPTTEEKFEADVLTFEKFQQDPMSYTNNDKLVVRINDKHYTWKQAQPVLLSLILFKQKLPEESVSPAQTPTEPPKKNWSRWFGFRSQADTQQQEDATSSGAQDDTEVAVIMDPTEINGDELKENIETKNEKNVTMEDLLASTNKNLMKTTRLTPQQLADLQLKEGANTITFSVTTQYQGTKRCHANIHRWKWNDRVVVSDIDGTITKSDVFGQILPVVGKDWTQGGVAKLYHNISSNGYKFIYLSARAIGQASMTKDYLNWVNQHGVTLPPGPLLLSPSSLLTAFKREVIERKPEVFKIACLNDIKSLFPIGEPFYAGFGNKKTDVISYEAVNIPKERMFTINHRGELVQENIPTYLTTLSDLGLVVDNYFPYMRPNQENLGQENYSDFSFWKSDVPSISDEEIKKLMGV